MRVVPEHCPHRFVRFSRTTSLGSPLPVLTLPSFTFSSGVTFTDVPVAYETLGQLGAAADNAVIVCHALTGSADAASWWGPLIGPGKALDTECYFVICLNVLGSPYGTISPATAGPDGRRLGSRFPVPTIRDNVRLHRAALDMLGVQGAALALGGSMGGMQALEWAFERTPEGAPYVRAIAPIAASGRHSAWCIGWSEAQRLAIYADARWQGGDYGPNAHPDDGLAAARAMAMISYRSATAFQMRHSRAVMDDGSFSVESYLRYQGHKLVGRFDAACYVRITQMMDTHDVSVGRGAYEAVLGSITQPALCIGVDSDVLYLPEESRELARLIPGGTYREITSPWGHDAFLIEFGQLDRYLRAWEWQ